MSRAAIRHVEADLGFSATSEDFIRGAEKASGDASADPVE